MVPKGPVSNLMFRREISRRCIADTEFAEMMLQVCEQDFFFWLNTFVWTINQKRTFLRKTLPFISFGFQDEGFDVLLDSLENGFDVQVEKTRQMGASWMFCVVTDWCWRFRHGYNFLLLSRKDEYVDKSDEPKSLFWKLDFIHNHLPRWLMPKGWVEREHRKVKRLVNPETGSTIVGEATTEDSGRGGTFSAVLIDEFSACEVGMGILKSTRDATATRWFNATPRGTASAHYRIVRLSRQNPKQVRPLRFHWSMHPEFNRGMYRLDEHGDGHAVDPINNPLPENYFVENADLITSLKKRGLWECYETRAPWFDKQCGRATTKAEIAQEIEIDYLESGYQFFEGRDINDLIRLYCCPPRQVGDLEYDIETLEPTHFVKHNRGRLELWTELVSGAPPLGRSYVVGVDASAGTGASNSVAAVWEANSGEKVAAFVSPNIRPERMAKVVIALCKWFGGAYLIWETNGSGRAFGDAIIEWGYSNYYSRAKKTETGETGGKAGWAPTRDNKYQLLAQYRGALADRIAFNRCEHSMRECLEYVFLGNNWVEHASLKDLDDPSGARDQHGDRVIADALATKVFGDQPKMDMKVLHVRSLMSVAGRREEAKRRDKQQKSRYVFR